MLSIKGILLSLLFLTTPLFSSAVWPNLEPSHALNSVLGILLISGSICLCPVIHALAKPDQATEAASQIMVERHAKYYATFLTTILFLSGVVLLLPSFNNTF
jgi:hypothetical protein